MGKCLQGGNKIKPLFKQGKGGARMNLKCLFGHVKGDWFIEWENGERLPFPPPNGQFDVYFSKYGSHYKHVTDCKRCGYKGVYWFSQGGDMLQGSEAGIYWIKNESTTKS